MKFKSIFLILVLYVLCANSSFAQDAYPEMTMSPMFSALNPAYINQEETDTSGDSLLDMFKRDESSNIKKEQRPSFITKFKKSKSKENGVDLDTSDMTFEEYYDLQEETDEYTQEPNEEYTQEDFNKDVAKTKNKNRGADLVKEIEKEQKEKELAAQGVKSQTFLDKTKNVVTRIWPFSKKKKDEAVQTPENEPGIELSAEYMDYYPERYEVEAVGKAKVTFLKQNTVLSANKIIYNYDLNILKAKGNVTLIAQDSITEGDFVRLDLNKPQGWMENPLTSTDDIRLSAKEAFLYSDKIEEYDGVAKILKDERLTFGARSFSSYLNNSTIAFDEKEKVNMSEYNGIYKLKAKTINIESKKDHEIITVKNADLYLKNFKLASVPSVKIVSNKLHNNMETNVPEFGSISGLGAHIGPAVVLNIPGGSTLKLAPVLTYASDKFGVGGIARYRNPYNMTEVAYGTSKEEFLIRGKQKIAKGLTLNYSRFTNQNEWFLGFRRPKYSLALNYNRSDYVKDLDLHFTQLYSAGAYVDNAPNQHIGDAEGRFRWMTQTYKPFYTYKNEEGNLAFSTGVVAQTSSTVYTTGDVSGIFRVGPAIQTKVGPWQQSLMYYQTAIAGREPFEFDRYRYGRSNFLILESLKVSKYLTVGYLASLAMNRENHNDDLFQENRFIVSIGPEYAKFTIGYDAYRQNTMFVFSMAVGTKDSDIEFEKTVINNPNNLGKKKSKTKKVKKKNYKKYVRETKPFIE